MNIREGVNLGVSRLLLLMVVAMTSFATLVAGAGIAAAAPPESPGKPGDQASPHGKPTRGTVLVRTSQFTIVVENDKPNHKPSGEVTPQVVSDCGWASCSIYYSRSETRAQYQLLTEQEAVNNAVSAICGLSTFWVPIGTIVGGTCVVFLQAQWPFYRDAVIEAAQNNKCLRMRVGFPSVISWYVDDSGYCTD